MNEETMAMTRHEKLLREEPVYAHLLGEFRIAEGSATATPERELKAMKARIGKLDSRYEREARAHATDLRRFGTEAHTAVLELAGYSLETHVLRDAVTHRAVDTVTTVERIEA